MCMDEYAEDTGQNGRLYNREVLNLLFKYVLRYRRYLLIALLFVLFITGSNLVIPYLLKTIVDRFIFKQGRVVEFLWAQQLDRRLLRGLQRLGEDTAFLYQSQLKHLTKKEMEKLEGSGILSGETYLLVTPPQLEGRLGEKLAGLLASGKAIRYGAHLLINTDSISEFTLNELLALRQADFRNVLVYVLVIVGVLFLQFGASYVQIVYLMKLSQLAMKDLRKDLFAHLLTFEVTYFDQNRIGRLVNRVTNDIETLNELFSSVLVTLFQDLLMMLGIALVMFFTDLYLAAVVSLTYPFIILFTIVFRIQVRNAYRIIRTRISELNSFLNETITGMRVIQIFVREMKNFQNFRGLNSAVFQAQLKQLYVYAVFRPLISFLRWFSIAAVIYFGARGIGLDRVSYGVLVMFIAYIERFFAPVQDLSEKFDLMQNANAAGEKIISVFGADASHEALSSDHKSRGHSRQPRDYRFLGDICFEDVWFSYKPEEWVLKGISFSVRPEETLAIVGETGAGKSTIVSVLSKYYRHQKGRILIDGLEIEEIPHWRIRKNFAAVMQDVFLFSRSIRENIILGRPFDQDWFDTVCRVTHVDRFIRELPGGDMEQVMERGVTFSAGERQLLSFARALYFNPSVLVLDEATSSIDTETERLIQDAIMNLTKGRTSIVIAHRLSTIKHADRIIVIDRGRIVEEGNHKSLLAKKGIYHTLYHLQFSNLV